LATVGFASDLFPWKGVRLGNQERRVEVHRRAALRSTTLFRTDDPAVALQRMAEAATAVADVIEAQKLYVRIHGKKYVFCTGWKTVGGMYGLAPYTAWTKLNETGDGYIARVEIRTLDERTVAAAEGECARDEDTWKNRPKHALRAMAETRATSRAFRGPLEQIFVLAGFAATAAEEMTASDTDTSAADAKNKALPADVKPTEAQRADLQTLVRTLERIDPTTDWWQRCRELAGVAATHLTRSGAEALIDRLQQQLAQFADTEAQPAS
jgi:hypothetical protein